MDKNSAKLLEFAAATNNELYDPDWEGGKWMIEARETSATLDHFAFCSEQWAERSKTLRGQIGGLRYIGWSRIQRDRGDPRHPMTVVDFGDARMVLMVDITDF